MDDPYQITRDFEAAVAEWAGSQYAVAVESGTAALFLSLMYAKSLDGDLGEITIPKRTYPSVPCAIIHAGGKVKWSNEHWHGIYRLKPHNIVDAALRFKKGMYDDGLWCLSFHIKKHLPIGRGGMILTNSPLAYEWLKRARFDGRGEVPLLQDNFTMLGWNCYMTPEQSARGLQLFNLVKDKENPDMKVEEQGYPDLSQFEVYTR